MKVSRREFVRIAGGAAAASPWVYPLSGFAASRPGSPASVDCTLLDLQSNCVLPESLAGMQFALGDSHRRIAVSELSSGALAGVVIVAAARSVKPDLYRAVVGSLERGARVLWESGAAFLDASDFAQQQALTKEHFGISIAQPINVWPRASARKSKSGATIPTARNIRAIGHEQIPYITYRWPNEAHVRDFSRIIPVDAAAGHAIAHWGPSPVAWSKKIGAGVLVFLGSPVGPALLAGDTQTRELFQSIVAV